MAPRQKFTSTAFAMEAVKADSVISERVATDKIPDGLGPSDNDVHGIASGSQGYRILRAAFTQGGGGVTSSDKNKRKKMKNNTSEQDPYQPEMIGFK